MGIVYTRLRDCQTTLKLYNYCVVCIDRWLPSTYSYWSILLVSSQSGILYHQYYIKQLICLLCMFHGASIRQ